MGQTEQHPLTLRRMLVWALLAVVVLVVLFGLVQAVKLLVMVKLATWGTIFVDALLTFLRTAVAMLIAVAWTVPLGVAIGMNPRWSRRLQSVVQVVASIPATALFPVLLIFLLRLPAGIEIAAIALMLLGTQWYVLFNVIAGAMAIPADLLEAAKIYRVTGWRLWRTLILPAIFPYLVTGMITASGGAWNASVVAEVVQYHGKTVSAPGLGAEIALAAANGQFATLLASTLVMAAVVVTVNRLVWKRLYQISDRRFALGQEK